MIDRMRADAGFTLLELLLASAIAAFLMAGLYTAPPAHGPRITLICGVTPEAITLRWNTSA